MWLEKFLDLISKVIPTDTTSELRAELSRLNPDKIYVENVRSLLHVSARTALDVLETAVRQGVLRKGIEVRCPDGAVAVAVDSGQSLPEQVHCWQDEEEIEIPTSELSKVTFYRLNDERAAAVVHR